MSRNFRILLAIAGITFASSLLTSASHADHDNDDDGWEDYSESWEDQQDDWGDQQEQWHDQGYYSYPQTYYHQPGYHQHGYHQHGQFYRPGGAWDRLHGSYERHPEHGYVPQYPCYGQSWYGYGRGYGYGYPHYGRGFRGYGGSGFGFYLRTR